MRVRLPSPELTNYVWRYLNWEGVRRYFRARATGTTGNMPKINAAVLRELEVPLPPLDMLPDLNRAIERSDGAIARSEAEATRCLALLDRLDAAVLARACRGELVPQDPAEEPTPALLARPRATQQAGPPRRGRRVA